MLNIVILRLPEVCKITGLSRSLRNPPKLDRESI